MVGEPAVEAENVILENDNGVAVGNHGVDGFGRDDGIAFGQTGGSHVAVVRGGVDHRSAGKHGGPVRVVFIANQRRSRC